MRAVRIGIDVGGTFTDAVAIDEETYELIGQVKVPTTHDAPEGVAAGIVQSLHKLMEQYDIAPDQVRFIAHGTTQATNALLEGDVERVGIICAGTGMDGLRARSETQVGDLELAPGKWLRTSHVHAELGKLQEALRQLKNAGARVVVAAEPFSVDNPEGERAIMKAALDEGLPSAGTHEISKLYGLRIRTRTAVINASILPKMMRTATMTEESVKRAGIAAPLMVMRCDGGVMTVDEVRQRPILTLLSGPAAGVAGALMYERISDGILLEVGGTSTDISAIRNGRVMVDYAQVGGHKTYLTSLDVRTLGVAGGSVVRAAGGAIRDVGPRSAHIAGLRYAVYADPDEIVDPVLEYFAPKPGDPADYVCVRCADGQRFALTLSCAANLLGYVPEGGYARGNPESARRAFAPLAAAVGLQRRGGGPDRDAPGSREGCAGRGVAHAAVRSRPQQCRPPGRRGRIWSPCSVRRRVHGPGGASGPEPPRHLPDWCGAGAGARGGRAHQAESDGRGYSQHPAGGAGGGHSLRRRTGHPGPALP